MRGGSMSALRIVGAALLAVVAAACGNAENSQGATGRRGAPGSAFTVEVRGETAYFDVVTATTMFLPTGGRVTAPGGISCGVVGGVASTQCSADYPWGDPTAPTTVAFTATPDAAGGFGHYAFAGACTGNGPCVVRGNSDAIVAVRFARTQEGLGGHPNFSDAALHEPAYRDFVAGAPGALRCTSCHGANLQGQGIAVACDRCHAPPGELVSVASIGPEGGTLSLSNGPALEIGTGVLASATTLTVGVTSTTAPMPSDAQPVGPVYEFGPSGLVFSDPVTVTFPVPPGTTNPAVFWTTPDGTAFESIGGVVSGSTIEAQVTHFSEGFVGVVDPSLPRTAFAMAGIVALNGAGYRLSVAVSGRSSAGSPISSAIVSGPDIAPTSLAAGCPWAAVDCFQRAFSFGAVKPTPGATYVFSVTFADSTTETLSATLIDLGVGFPTPAFPASGEAISTMTPRFSWNAPPWGCVSRYIVVVNDSHGRIWSSGSLAPGTTSIPYNFNGTATLAALTDGSYSWGIFAFDCTGPSATETRNSARTIGTPFTVATGGATTGRATVTARIRDMQGVGYHLDLIAQGGGIASATVSGPTVAPNTPLPAGCAFATSDCFNLAGPLTPTKPNIGDVYRFTISYTDGTSEILHGIVHDLTVGYPTLVSPAFASTVASGTPTFSWNAPSTGCVSSYSVIVEDGNGARIWRASVSPATTSVVYDFDGSASVPTLPQGNYRWFLRAYDDCAAQYPSPSNWASTGVSAFAVGSSVTAMALIQRTPSGYGLDLVTEGRSGAGSPIAAITVTGPGIAPTSLNPDCAWASQECFEGLVPFGSSQPIPGATYDFTITFADLTVQTLTATVSGLGVGFAALGSPADGETVRLHPPVSSATPMFTWTAPTSGCVSRYAVFVDDALGNRLWTANDLVPGTTWAAYDFDGTATAPALSAGSYFWNVLAFDCTTDSSRPYGNYTMGSGADFTVVVTSFFPTGSMISTRGRHAATLLPDGTVLVTGGYQSPQSGTGVAATAELYDATTGSFSPRGQMGTARVGHTSTLLSSGRVLIAGGATGSGSLVVGSTELYDPATGAFTPGAPMTSPRQLHTATSLGNGKLLLVGGFNNQAGTLGTAELYDPDTATFTPVGSMAAVRYVHTATLLPNGTVLVAGGYGSTGQSLATAEIFDPATNAFAPAGDMARPRGGHTATLLPNEQVLLAGGFYSGSASPNGGMLASAELYDWTTNTFVATGGLTGLRGYHTATLLPSGEVLLAGGITAVQTSGGTWSTEQVATAELYDPALAGFAGIGPMTAQREFPSATLLADGTVLVAGGYGTSPSTDPRLPPTSDYTASAEIYVPAASGVASWVGVKQLGTASPEWPDGLALDEQGDVYVSGSTDGAFAGHANAGRSDLYVAKLDRRGDVAWVRQYGTAEYDGGSGVAVDAAGYVYVTGWTDGAFAGYVNAIGAADGFVLKMDANGNTVWMKQFGTELSDVPHAVVVDAQGHVYVSGSTSGAFPGQVNAGASDAFVAEIGAFGDVLWVEQFGSAGNDHAEGLALGPQGKLYVSGFTDGAFEGSANAGGTDAFVAEIQPAVGLSWAKQFGTAGNEFVYGLAVDAQGNAHVAGSTNGAFAGHANAGSFDAFAAKLDTAGSVSWVRQLGTTGFVNDDNATAVFVDAQFAVYVAGDTTGAFEGNTNAGSSDAYVAKLDSSGSVSWVRQFGSTGNDYRGDLAMDAQRNMFVSGWTGGVFPGNACAGSFDVFVAKLDAQGLLQ